MFTTLIAALSLLLFALSSSIDAIPTSSPSNSTHVLVSRGTCGSKTFRATDLVGSFNDVSSRVWLKRDNCAMGRPSMRLSIDPVPLTINIELVTEPSVANMQRRNVMLFLTTQDMKDRMQCLTQDDVKNLLTWYTSKECKGVDMPQTLSNKKVPGAKDGSMVVGKNSPFQGLKWEFVVQ